MNILMVSADSSIGGLATHIIDLAKGLKERGHTIYVATPSGYLFSSLKGINNITPIKISINSKFSLHAILELRRLYKALKANGNFIIHVHGVRAGFLGRLAAVNLKIPLVYTEHLWTEDYTPLSSIRKFEQIYMMRLLDKTTAHTICVSQAVKKFLLKNKITTSNKTSVVYHALPAALPPAAQSVKGTPIIGYAGSLNKTKRLDILLRSVALLKNDDVSFTLEIIGEGLEKEKLRRLSRTLEIEKNVVWQEPKPDLKEYMKKWWVAAMASDSESFSYLALMAMSMGIPVVATRVGGLPEVVAGGAGILVERDNPMVFRDALKKVFQGPVHIEMSVKAKEQSKKFKFEDMLKDTEAAYEEAQEFAQKKWTKK